MKAKLVFSDSLEHTMRTWYAIFLTMLLLLAHAASYAADAAQGDSCRKYSAAKARLLRIHREYVSLPRTTENAEKLFLLYRRLEQAAKKAQAMYPADNDHNYDLYAAISRCLWDDKLEGLGLGIEHYSVRLEYSEKLMAEAHRLNPHTQYRSYTLYTEVLGKAIGVDSDEIPDADKAKAYLKEFPDGPYVRNVYALLAGFYHDLYAALRSIKEEPIPERRDITFFCFADYIDTHPKDAKLERARKQAIFYIGKVLATTPLIAHRRQTYVDELDALKKENTDNVHNICWD